MKGLLRKDFEYVLAQKSVALIIILFSGVGMFISQSNPDFATGFVDGYLVMVLAVVGMSTFSYDEADNSMTFLMSMPVDRKIYVNSKYMFDLILSVAAGIVVTLVHVCLCTIGGLEFELTDCVIMISAFMSVVMVLNSITIPAFLKFGYQKGMIGMFGAVVVIVGACYGLSKLLGKLGFDLEEIAMNLLNMDEISLAALFIVVAAILMTVSYCIAQKIVQNKEF